MNTTSLLLIQAGLFWGGLWLLPFPTARFLAKALGGVVFALACLLIP